MNKLHITSHNGIETIDSREVAEMVDKRHRDLLRDIRGYIDIMEEANERNFTPVGGERKIAPSEFFLESSYISEQNKPMPCYLITKKGCDMIANKLTGRKGVLFTAAYVTAFEQMRERLAHPTPEVSPSGLARLISKSQEIMQTVGKSSFDIYAMMQSVYRAWNIPMPDKFYKQESDPVSSQLVLWDSPKEVTE